MQPLFRFLSLTATALVLFTAISSSDDGTATADTDTAVAAPAFGFSGDPNRPRRHFRVANTTDLDPKTMQRHYQRMVDDMSLGYAVSDLAAAKSYRRWKKYNNAPYLSATHGRRFVNNYANAAASAYGLYEQAGTLPKGAILVKDSLMAADNGIMAAGPMFIMEKMAPGFNYVSGDWRYTMVLPDGSIFGVTKGENSERVEFCIGCHLAREPFDHLFFIPKIFRTAK
jgi:hypothetical protein